jgi:tetratricopeptide (TPR) repeat protein
MARNNLGNALREQKKFDEAIACFREGTRLAPEDAKVHHALARALAEQNRLDEALAVYRTATRLDPQEAGDHYAMGIALRNRGKVDEAIGAYRETVRLDPRHARAHNNLGNALRDRGRLDEAIGHFREALRLDPTLAKTYQNLGSALRARGRLDEAAAAYREAARLDPKDAQARVNLGFILNAQGRFAEALPAFRRGQDLAAPTDPRLPELRQVIRQCQVLLEGDVALAAVLRGEASPATAADGVMLGWLCQQPYRKRYAASARLYRDAFAARPQLAGDPRQSIRYNAACAAVLVSRGRGEDASGLGEEERTAWRRQALAWLRADLALWDKLAAANPAVVRQRLQHWWKDADLAGVRDQAALAQFPEAERAAWQKLWAEVEALRKKAQGKD